MLRLASSPLLSCRRRGVYQPQLFLSKISSKLFSATGRHNEESQITEPPRYSYVAPPSFTKNSAQLRKIALSSMGLSVGLAPVILTVEGSLPTTARVFFIATAVLTSLSGTSLIRYI